MAGPWLTSDQVAELLRVRPATVAQWRWRRRGPSFRRFVSGRAASVQSTLRFFD
jgi:hypothetical protein